MTLPLYDEVQFILNVFPVFYSGYLLSFLFLAAGVPSWGEKDHRVLMWAELKVHFHSEDFQIAQKTHLNIHSEKNKHSS